MKTIFELPFRSTTCGGVLATLQLAKEMDAKVVYQTDINSAKYFEDCDLWITYSDNPYVSCALAFSHIKRVAVYMQSYGMSIVNERRNALNERILCLCTTKKIEQAIIADGGKPHRIGFGLNMDGFVNLGYERKNYLAILVHDMESKRTALALQVADSLLRQGVIEGIVTFGGKLRNRPKGLIKHYENATREQVCEVFNQCKAYLMPSVSEGLNMTPIESTLCGCPSIIVDGAIGEIFIQNMNCFVRPKDDINEFADCISNTIKYHYIYSDAHADYMREIIKYYTWDKVANNLKELL